MANYNKNGTGKKIALALAVFLMLGAAGTSLVMGITQDGWFENYGTKVEQSDNVSTDGTEENEPPANDSTNDSTEENNQPADSSTSEEEKTYERVTLTYGNDYMSTTTERKNRLSIQPYGVMTPSDGVTLTVKSGYEVIFYALTDIDDPTNSTTALTWTAESVGLTGGKLFGISIRKTDNTEFDLTTDSIYVSDYIDSSDTSIWLYEV